MKDEILDLSEAEYQADKVADVPSLSASIAKILCNETPLHCWTAHPRLNPNFEREDKEMFDLGIVAHALMLQGSEVATVLDFPDWRTKEAREARDDARQNRKVPILKKNWERVQAMVEAGKAQIAVHKEAKDAFSDGKPEQSLVWTDDHGVVCRARLDWLMDSHARIYDYKTTGATANPEAMGRFIIAQGWDVQAAFYLRGLKAVTGKDAEFFFVCQEDYLPYALSVLGLSEEFLILGAKKVQYAIDLWAQCLASGKWPAYPNRIVDPPFPVWAAEQWAFKEIQ